MINCAKGLLFERQACTNDISRSNGKPPWRNIKIRSNFTLQVAAIVLLSVTLTLMYNSLNTSISCLPCNQPQVTNVSLAMAENFFLAEYLDWF